MATNARKPKAAAPERAKRSAASARGATGKRAKAKPAPAAAPAAEDTAAQSAAAKLGAAQLDMLLGAAGKTSGIVQQAASILEEELAAGIIAAKRVEARFVDVGKLRESDPKEVMQRFRRDAHDVVDILLDLVNVATNSLGGLAQRVVTVRGNKDDTRKNAAAALGTPSLTIPRPVKAGQSIEVPMTLENSSEAPTEALHFHSSDLISTDGARIPAQQVEFAPTDLVIAPHGSQIVKVTLTVPAGTPAGTYAGLLQASKMEQLRAVVTVQIE